MEMSSAPARRPSRTWTSTSVPPARIWAWGCSRRRRTASAVLACLVLLGIWYHVPLRRTLETEICGNDGTSAVLRMEITLHRSFFRETMVLCASGLHRIRNRCAMDS